MSRVSLPDRGTNSNMLWFRYWPIFAVLLGLYAMESAWAAILLYHAGLLAGIWVRRDALREVRWRSSPLAIFVAVQAGLVAYPAVRFGLPFLVGSGGVAELGTRLEQLGLIGSFFSLFFLYFVTVHPVLEEVGWRGVLQEKSARPHLHDVEFAAYHLPVLWWLFPGQWGLLALAAPTLAAMAWIWRIARDRFGLIAVIFFHAVADFGVISASALLVRGSG